MRYSELLLNTFDPLFSSYWNNRWSKKDVYYQIHDGTRNLITDFLTQSVVEAELNFLKINININDDDESEVKMYKIETWVKNNFHYIADKTSWNQAEYWQSFKESLFKRTGDCEDGAILIYCLAILYGVPAWRIKLCAGYVTNPKTNKKCGHAYIIFLRNDMTWCVCDWCYYPTVSRIQNRPQHKEMTKYNEIWWTSNHYYSWAQKDVALNFEGL